MTAIIAGRLNKANFIAVDAMVQLSLEVSSYKECRLQDKISDLDQSEQYLVLAGEQLIGDGANLLNYWSQIKKIKYDLFDDEQFKNVLELALRYRNYHVDIHSHPIIEQDMSDVYVVGRNRLKHYEVKFQNSRFEVLSVRDLPENFIEINYKGNIIQVAPPKDETDIQKFCIDKLNEEHNRRKTTGYLIGQNPLRYDFEDRFSVAILPTDLSQPITRNYPFDFPTDVFLGDTPDWDYVTDVNFRFLPKP